MNCEQIGRPRGELRSALALVFAAASKAMTWHGAADQLVATQVLRSVGPSELKLIRRTVENMARAGELTPCGYACWPGSRRPLTLYRVATADDVQRDAEIWVALTHALHR